LSSEGVEVKVREKFSFCVKSDGAGMGTMTVPKNRVAVVSKMEAVGSPVDERVDASEPWFAEDEVVVGKRVGE
jgi:hypothetical protein